MEYLDGFHTHSMRHKFATDLLEKGANIKAVQELLGHENLATTEVYLSIVDQGLHDAVSLLEKEKEEEELMAVDPHTGWKWPRTY